SWNPGFEEITGYQAADMVGSRGLARLRPRDVADREVQLDRWADEQAALPPVIEVLRPNGEACWLACSWTRVPAGDGRPRPLILTSRDITKELELKRAEKALRDSAARFRALVQNSSHMVIVLDAGGGITYARPAFRRVLGFRGGAPAGPAGPGPAATAPAWPRAPGGGSGSWPPAGTGATSRPWPTTCSTTRPSAGWCSTAATSPSARGPRASWPARPRCSP